jgi:hypothetical protein
VRSGSAEFDAGVKEALGFLNKSQGNSKGGRELNEALAELKKLGYTKGS